MRADYGHSVVLTDDEGYAITGNTFSYGAGRSDVHLVKTDASGNMQWSAHAIGVIIFP
jgi:hypothetical protein